jgi:hypothetical protein
MFSKESGKVISESPSGALIERDSLARVFTFLIPVTSRLIFLVHLPNKKSNFAAPYGEPIIQTSFLFQGIIFSLNQTRIPVAGFVCYPSSGGGLGIGFLGIG